MAGAGLRADTVVMNPPFGTRRRGADMDFLRAAFAGAVPRARMCAHPTALHRQAVRRVAAFPSRCRSDGCAAPFPTADRAPNILLNISPVNT